MIRVLHRVAHALRLTKMTRKHGRSSGVVYSWDECGGCEHIFDGLAHDQDADRWYIPGPRELRHNVQLIREMEDP